MAYIFPPNPADGTLYPVPATPGSLQYQWSSAQNCWLIYSPLGVQSITAILPLEVNNPTDDAVISILPATINTPGTMSAEDKEKLDNIPQDAAPGTVTQINTGAGLSGGPITLSGTINIDVDGNGVISIPAARFGVTSINVGPGLVGSPSPITNTGTISAALATRLTVGSVRVGSGVGVAPDGTISVDGSLSHVGVLAWATVRIVNNTDPPQFQLLEGYNISSVTWQGTQATPRVQLNFQNTLVNTDYGFAWGAGAYQRGDNAQYNFNITSGFKSTTYFQIQLATFWTPDWTVPGNGEIIFNNWPAVTGSAAVNGPSTFDIAIIDSQNF